MIYSNPILKAGMDNVINIKQVDSKESYFNNSMIPINIDDNGGTTGSISWEDAKDEDWCTKVDGTYYIENLTIEAYRRCISIRDSSVNFVIRNCTLINNNDYWNDNNNYGALYLSNIENGLISHNTMISYYFGNGIYLGNSNNNVILNNTCSNNGVSYGFYEKNGILLSNSDHNVITNNTCSDNNNNGISLSDSQDNTIMNNTCLNNGEDGISLSNSDNNDIIDNTCSINENNGILLSESNDNIITNNTCSNNIVNGKNGIALNHCLKTIVLNNTCFSNIENGIYIQDSNSTLLANNTVSFNDQSGIYLESTKANSFYNISISHNLIHDNTYYGIHLLYIGNFTLFDNYINNNGGWGISMSYCSNITSNYNFILNNTVDSNRYGIVLYRSAYTKIFYNNITNNIEYGIYLQEHSDHNMIIDNYLSNNGIYCICYEENCIYNFFSNTGCTPVKLEDPDDGGVDSDNDSNAPPLLGYLYPVLFVILFISMISGLAYYSNSKRKRWRENGIEFDQYGRLIIREESTMYDNYDLEKPKIVTPKEVKPYEFYCLKCKKKYVGHQVFCPECGGRMKIYDPSFLSSPTLIKDKNNTDKCVLCHQSTCPTCDAVISGDNACVEECPYCESTYHQHCWDTTIEKFGGRCAFCLETPPQELVSNRLKND